MQYAFQLGREPLLSIAEITSVCQMFGIHEIPQPLVHDIVTSELDEASAERIFDKLGGSIKLGIVRKELSRNDFLSDPIAAITTESFLQACVGKETSVAFALSVFGDAPEGFSKRMKQVGLTYKKRLKETYAHVRYVVSNEKTISSVTVKRNKLLRGIDLWIVFSGDRVLLIQTIAVQDYREFARHDYSRPTADAVAGMLPPKLARMMVNLSGVDEHVMLADVCVGSGTVLQEAALLGVKKLFGSDIDPRAVANTKTNLAWLANTYNLRFSLATETMPVAGLQSSSLKDVTHVVSEIDLGPPLRKRPQRRELQPLLDNASLLAAEILSFVRELPHFSSMVLAVPFWPQGNAAEYISLAVPPRMHLLQPTKELSKRYPFEHSTRGGYMYIRPGQFVGREILVLQKTR